MQMSKAGAVKNLLNKMIKMRQKMKHNFATSIKGVRKLVYVQCVIRQIELEKQIFLIDVESGQFTEIPPRLSMDHLPLSFRYYDPVMILILNNMQ